MRNFEEGAFEYFVNKLKDKLGLKADKTYVDNKVKTDVPAGAKFTDTVYSHPDSHPASMITESSTKRFVSDSEKSTWNSKPDTDTVTTINGKTGAISKADIVALGIPAQDTVVDISGKADKTYVDGKVKTDVPVGAKFTDTIYTHPASHPASIITESTTKKFVSDTEKANWNNKWDYNESTVKAVKVNSAGNADTVNGKTVAENVPAGAKFTDTITSINGKTGTIAKADIVALGIPAQDTVYTHPGSGTNPHGTTKANVGLGSVLNYGVATQTESETGTSNAKYMTPLRTKQAIDKFKPKIITSATEPNLSTGDQWHKEI